MEQEAEQAIDKAFNEGYKQGLLSAAPDAEYWHTKATKYESEIIRLKKNKWLYALGGFGAGFITGGGITLAVSLRL